MMKSTPIALCCLVLAAPMVARAGVRLIPAGTLIQCTVSEPKLNSKTTAVGDPILCQVGYSEHYSFALPYYSYLVGRFEDYKDPGHFVGKGWMDLVFDHMIVEPDTVIPLDAKVVGVPGYNTDREGRILGKGHRVRDTVEWMIPVLWPIDLLNLPRRGPRPTLKSETRLTLKVMNDFGVPDGQPPLQQDPSGLYKRAPSAYTVPRETEPQAAPVAQAAPDLAPVTSTASESQPAVAPPAPVPYQPAYMAGPAQPPIAEGAYYVSPRPVYVSPYAQAWAPRMMIVVRNGIAYQVFAP